MKLPASVIREALEPLADWRLTAEEPEMLYGFPRQFDGGRPAPGHVLLVPPEAGSAPGRASLAVYTAPADVPPRGGPALIPGREVPLPEAERAVAAVFDRMEDWSEALDACPDDLTGVQRMLELSAAAMGGSLGLIDESYNMPAYTGDFVSGLGIRSDADGTARPSDESVFALSSDPQITAVRSARGVRLYENASDEGRTLFRNLFRPGEDAYFNRLLFARPGSEYTRTDRFMLEYLAARIERITRNLPTFALPSSRFAAFKQLILTAAGPEELPPGDHIEALSPMGWQRGETLRFYLFRSVYDRRDTGINEYLLRQLEELIPASCGVVSEGRLLLVQNTARSRVPFRELRPRLAEFLRENMYKAGISNEAASFDRLRGAFLQARAAMDLGSSRDPMFWYYLFEDYLGDYLLRRAAGEIPADMLTLPAVEALYRHDAEKGTSYVRTLGAYVRENFNVTHAARRLYIHRTSFQDRMERIRDLTGLDTEDPEVRFLLQFSFRLRSLRPD